MSNGAAAAVASVDVLRPPITRCLPSFARSAAPKHVPLVVPSVELVVASIAFAASAASSAPVVPSLAGAPSFVVDDGGSATASLAASAIPELLLLEASAVPEPLDEPRGAGPASASRSSPTGDEPHAVAVTMPKASAASAPGHVEAGFLIPEFSARQRGW